MKFLKKHQSKIGKIAAPVLVAFAVVLATAVNGCSQNDRSTAAREEAIIQNAIDAEAAEASLASHSKESDKKSQAPAKSDVAKNSKGGKGSKKPKAHAQAKASHDGAHASVAKQTQSIPEAKNEVAAPSAGAKTPESSGASSVAHHDHDQNGGDQHKVPQPEAKSSSDRKPAAVAGGVYVLQVGAFRVKENAQKLKDTLVEAGYKVEMETIEHSKNGLLHIVHFPPTEKRADAETQLAELASKRDLRGQIVVSHK